MKNGAVVHGARDQVTETPENSMRFSIGNLRSKKLRQFGWLGIAATIRSARHKLTLELAMRHHRHITFHPINPRPIAHLHTQAIQALAQGPIEDASGVLLPIAAVHL